MSYTNDILDYYGIVSDSGLSHYAKGQRARRHKYVSIKNGRYIYPTRSNTGGNSYNDRLQSLTHQRERGDNTATVTMSSSSRVNYDERLENVTHQSERYGTVSNVTQHESAGRTYVENKKDTPIDKLKRFIKGVISWIKGLFSR